MSAKWTEAQIASAHEWHRLVENQKDGEAEPIQEQLEKELGHDGSYELLEFIEDYRERSAKPAPTKPRRGVLKPARSVSKSVETWRCLSNYPLYEISSHGRVRALDRAKPGDWLKPRLRWFRGQCVAYVVLRDRDGRRCERMVGKLLIAAAFMPKPEWMKNDYEKQR
jgi:hypothetical protein